jgi:hypothetical protein
VSIKVYETAIRVMGRSKPVSLLLHLGEFTLLTDLVDSASDSILEVDLPHVHVLLTEDYTYGHGTDASTTVVKSEHTEGWGRWKVNSCVVIFRIPLMKNLQALGYATLAEVESLQIAVHQIKTPGTEGTHVSTNVAFAPASRLKFPQVNVSQGDINIHLCADTAVAISALTTDLGPPSTESDQQACVCFQFLCLIITFTFSKER